LRASALSSRKMGAVLVALAVVRCATHSHACRIADTAADRTAGAFLDLTSDRKVCAFALTGRYRKESAKNRTDWLTPDLALSLCRLELP
jgi:hypothetical protein